MVTLLESSLLALIGSFAPDRLICLSLNHSLWPASWRALLSRAWVLIPHLGFEAGTTPPGPWGLRVGRSGSLGKKQKTRVLLPEGGGTWARQTKTTDVHYNTLEKPGRRTAGNAWWWCKSSGAQDLKSCPWHCACCTQVAGPTVGFVVAKRGPQKEGMQVAEWAGETRSGL